MCLILYNEVNQDYLESVYKYRFFVMPEVFNRASRLVPAKAGNHLDELGSRFHGKPWIPAQQTAGMTTQLSCLYTDTIYRAPHIAYS